MTADPAEPPSHDADFDALLDRVAAGDEVARRQFFLTYAPAVDRFVRFAFGLSYDDAQDVVQETLITAFTVVARFDRRRPVENWLCGIAGMKVKALRRMHGRAPTAWSTLARRQSDRSADSKLPSARSVEAALGDAVVSAGPDATVAAEVGAPPEPKPGRRTPPPEPPQPAGAEPYAAWGREIGAWLATQPPETQVIARRFTDGAAYAELAADLSDLLRRPVEETAVRQRASRFARDFAQRFARVLPHSRVRMPSTGDTSLPPGAIRPLRVPASTP